MIFFDTDDKLHITRTWGWEFSICLNSNIWGSATHTRHVQHHDQPLAYLHDHTQNTHRVSWIEGSRLWYNSFRYQRNLPCPHYRKPESVANRFHGLAIINPLLTGFHSTVRTETIPRSQWQAVWNRAGLSNLRTLMKSKGSCACQPHGKLVEKLMLLCFLVLITWHHLTMGKILLLVVCANYVFYFFVDNHSYSEYLGLQQCQYFNKVESFRIRFRTTVCIYVLRELCYRGYTAWLRITKAEKRQWR
jgi:hypothetical protein